MSPNALARTSALVLVVGCLTLASLRAGTTLPDRPRDAGPTIEAAPTALQRLFHATNFTNLPAEEFRLVEFLLLLPVAGLIIAVFRNVVGVPSFGTFAPVLIGLAFRHLEAWPGMLVFVSVLLVGWGLRRLLEPFHLLEVPRASLLLSIVVLGLVGMVAVCHANQIPVTRYISLFPLVILTGIIERLWAMEAEEGARASLRTLIGTLAISACIGLVLALPGLVATLVRSPELVGLFMAGQLLLGRYTGYRLTELIRFGTLADEPEPVILQATRAALTPAAKAALENTCHGSLDKTSALKTSQLRKGS